MPATPASTRPIRFVMSSGKYFRYKDSVNRKCVGWYSVTSMGCWSSWSVRDISSGSSAATWAAEVVCRDCSQPPHLDDKLIVIIIIKIYLIKPKPWAGCAISTILALKVKVQRQIRPVLFNLCNQLRYIYSAKLDKNQTTSIQITANFLIKKIRKLLQRSKVKVKYL